MSSIEGPGSRNDQAPTNADNQEPGNEDNDDERNEDNNDERNEDNDNEYDHADGDDVASKTSDAARKTSNGAAAPLKENQTSQPANKDPTSDTPDPDGKQLSKLVNRNTGSGETKGRGGTSGGAGLGDAGAGGNSGGSPLGAHIGGVTSRSGRPIKLTDKKQQYDREVKVKTLKAAISKWKGVAAQTEQNLAVSNDLFTLKGSCQPLQFASEQVRMCFSSVADALSLPEEEHYSNILDKVEDYTLDLMSKVSVKVRDIESEVKSRSSKRSSKHSSRRSTTSSQDSRNVSDKRSVAAAEVAALEAELRFSDVEASQRAELERQRALLEQTQLRKKYEMATARLKTFTDHEKTLADNSPEFSFPSLNVEAEPFFPRTSLPGINIPDTTPGVRDWVVACQEVYRHSQAASVQDQRDDIPTNNNPDTATVKHDRKQPQNSQRAQVDKGGIDVTTLSHAVADQVQLRNYPAPEPGIFSGDHMQYPSWRCAYRILVDEKKIPEAEKLYYLQRYLAGNAKEAVEGNLLVPTAESYQAAMALLDERYGDPATIADAFRNRLDNWPKVNNRDGMGLRKLSDFLRQCLLTMSTNKSLLILNDEKENQKILKKLPDWVTTKWVRIVAESRETNQAFPPFSRFLSFLQKEAQIACDPIASLQALGRDKISPTVNKPKVQPSARALHTTVKENKRTCLLCSKADHEIDECPSFLAKAYEERRELVKAKGLCFGCLRQGHNSKVCRSKKTCRTCSKRHPTSMHSQVPITKPQEGGQVTEIPAAQETPTVVTGSRWCDTQGSSSKTSTVVPVLLSHINNPGEERLVYAMLDTQSDTSFVLEKTCQSLGLQGSKVNLRLSTLSAQDELVPSRRLTGLQVRGLYAEAPISLPVAYTRDIMPANDDHIPTPSTARQWEHLYHIAEQIAPKQDCEVGLLIGYNCPQALVPRQVIPHPENEGPYGLLTDLGWSIVGTTMLSSKEDDPIGVSHRVLTCLQPTTTRSQIVLKTSIKEEIQPEGTPSASSVLAALERDFIECPGPLGEIPYSMDDARFLTLLERTIKACPDKHYEMPLPLREEQLPLTDNRKAAATRLNGLKRKFARDPEYKAAYTKTVEDLIKHGYAEPATKGHQAWFLPHHGVMHPRKPDKVRVVFDASAKHLGKSLNDVLLQGPDLTNKLLGVLLRFRQEKVAFSCDVESMFHQFRVKEEHRDYLRFLWWTGGDTAREPEEFRMTVHLFGARSSPSCANFGMKQIALDYGHLYSSAASSFLRDNFYVDDGLKSVSTVSEAVSLVQETRELCQCAGLRLHKFLSTSSAVMDAVPAEDRAHMDPESKTTEHEMIEDLELLPKSTTIERALGVCWCLENDTLGFRISLKEQPNTRRGILSTVASIYDPLGLACPFVLLGKQVLQDTCKEGFDWDAPLSEELSSRWDHWLKDLTSLERMEVPRCYKPSDFGNVKNIELHHFCDASTQGYGSCTYVRLVNEDGRIHCSLVMAKARVAPVKTVTIPRLELMAAVTAAKLSQMLQSEMGYPISCHKFWTDSKIVLGQLCNDSKRQEVFVANRIRKIRDISEPAQWDHVPTDQNPADLASRGCAAQELSESSMWLSGPSFLWSLSAAPARQSGDCQPENHAGSEPMVVNITNHSVTVHQRKADETSVLSSLARLSSWSRMKRVIAICQNAKAIFMKELSPAELTLEHIQRAEEMIIRTVQCAAFAQEIKDLSALKKLNMKSNIAKLDPFLDESGILRVGGRLVNSDIAFGERHPALLPKKHPITKAILYHFHQRVGHQGRSTTLNQVRSQGYWIINAGHSISGIISKCVTCRRLRGKTSAQQMANLPEDRLEACPPFTKVGMDFFGPFIIKERRSQVKRWGCIFTCLYSRAIHLEVATSLSTDAFLNVLRRFVSLRGSVRKLRCDKGTNFVGADNELTAALDEINEEKVRRYLSEQHCEFVFNPADASHMGGVWERPIRSVRSILASLLRDLGTHLDDDSLRTLMAEAAAIVNSQPLSLDNLNDPTSLNPVTANHLLTLKSSVITPPPGDFKQADIYSRKRWRRVQYLAGVFWTRWRKEYIQHLQARQRWLHPQRNLEVGDIVLVKADDVPRCHWRLGRISEANPDQDGHTRKVRVSMGDPYLNSRGQRTSPLTQLERPIHKLVLLIEVSQTEIDEEKEE